MAYIPLMTHSMLMIKELKKMLKEMELFFVLQILNRVRLVFEMPKDLITRTLKTISLNFNSLYQAPDSLYWFRYQAVSTSFSDIRFSKKIRK